MQKGHISYRQTTGKCITWAISPELKNLAKYLWDPWSPHHHCVSLVCSATCWETLGTRRKEGTGSAERATGSSEHHLERLLKGSVLSIKAMKRGIELHSEIKTAGFKKCRSAQSVWYPGTQPQGATLWSDVSSPKGQWCRVYNPGLCASCSCSPWTNEHGTRFTVKR